MAIIAYPYLTGDTDIGFLRTKQGLLHDHFWWFSFYAHITTSVVVLLAGATQFKKSILNKLPRIHKTVGKVYILLILFITAPSGFYMGLKANGGLPAIISFCLLSILWFVFTLRAYQNALKHQWQIHENYMIRSYALTGSAITLRLYSMILPSIILVRPNEMYVTIAWLGWVPNLLLAEWIINFRRGMA